MNAKGADAKGALVCISLATVAFTLATAPVHAVKAARFHELRGSKRRKRLAAASSPLCRLRSMLNVKEFLSRLRE